MGEIILFPCNRPPTSSLSELDTAIANLRTSGDQLVRALESHLGICTALCDNLDSLRQAAAALRLHPSNEYMTESY